MFTHNTKYRDVNLEFSSSRLGIVQVNLTLLSLAASIVILNNVNLQVAGRRKKQGSRAVCGKLTARDASHTLSMTHPFG